MSGINEYIKTHNPPYKLALLVFVLGFPLNMIITFFSVVFIGTAYTGYTDIPELINIYNGFGLTENIFILMFNLFGVWARVAIISLVIVTIWYGLKHFLNRDKLSRINYKDALAALAFIGAGFGFKMLMLFPW